jgi:hypothetical protein
MAAFVRYALLFFLSAALSYWAPFLVWSEQGVSATLLVSDGVAASGSPFSLPETRPEQEAQTLLQVIQQPTTYQKALRLILTERVTELSHWPQQDLDAVAAGLRASMIRGGAFLWQDEKPLAAFMKLYARRDAAKALLWAQNLPLVPLRLRMAPLGYAALAEHDLDSAFSIIDQTHSPGLAQEMKELCLSSLAATSPEVAMTWLAEHGSRGTVDSGVMREALTQHSFTKLWSLAQQLPDGPGKLHLQDALLSEGWGKEGMVQVLQEEAAAGRLRLDFFTTHPLTEEQAKRAWQATFGIMPEKLSADLAKSALRQMIETHGVAAAWADPRWLQTDAHRHYVLDAVAEAYEQTDSVLKAEQMLRQSLAALPVELHSQFLTQLMDGPLDKMEAQRLWPWIQKQGKDALTARLARQSQIGDGDSAKQWLRGITQPQQRDAALLGTLSTLSREQALTALPQLRSPQARMAAVKSIGARWLREDESAALAWLKAQSATAADISAVRLAAEHGSAGGTFLPNGEWLPE